MKIAIIHLPLMVTFPISSLGENKWSDKQLLQNIATFPLNPQKKHKNMHI